MKSIAFLVLLTLICHSCSKGKPVVNQETQIMESEKSFEKMVAEKGIAEAFYFFADDNAVIKRQNDTLIKGKENILAYYKKREQPGTHISWSPDYIYVSESGDLAYTYGKYEWRITQPDSITKTFNGIFHTVWKKQADGSWKYVWD